MTTRRVGIIGALLAALVLSACGSDNPTLMNIRNDDRGPDEFAILPVKPLEAPPDFRTLPTPTPGAANLTDPTPELDAVAALGGRPSAAQTDGTIRGEPSLVAHVGRYGIQPGIRESLAAEDLEFRRRNDGRLLERIFNVNVYYKAYRKQALDQYAELERFRRAGIRTPAAPPEQLAE